MLDRVAFQVWCQCGSNGLGSQDLVGPDGRRTRSLRGGHKPSTISTMVSDEEDVKRAHWECVLTLYQEKA